MNKERRVNIIKALKEELHRYKKSRVQYVINQHIYDRLRLQSCVLYEDVLNTPEEVLENVVKDQIADKFRKSLGTLIPFYTEDDERMRTKKVVVDIYVRR